MSNEQKSVSKCILGLSENENETDAVNKKYRRLARENHPDKGGPKDVMVKLNQAKDCLLNLKCDETLTYKIYPKCNPSKNTISRILPYKGLENIKNQGGNIITGDMIIDIEIEGQLIANPRKEVIVKDKKNKTYFIKYTYKKDHFEYERLQSKEVLFNKYWGNPDIFDTISTCVIYTNSTIIDINNKLETHQIPVDLTKFAKLIQDIVNLTHNTILNFEDQLVRLVTILVEGNIELNYTKISESFLKYSYLNKTLCEKDTSLFKTKQKHDLKYQKLSEVFGKVLKIINPESYQRYQEIINKVDTQAENKAKCDDYVVDKTVNLDICKSDSEDLIGESLFHLARSKYLQFILYCYENKLNPDNAKLDRDILKIIAEEDTSYKDVFNYIDSIIPFTFTHYKRQYQQFKIKTGEPMKMKLKERLRETCDIKSIGTDCIYFKEVKTIEIPENYSDKYYRTTTYQKYREDRKNTHLQYIYINDDNMDNITPNDASDQHSIRKEIINRLQHNQYKLKNPEIKTDLITKQNNYISKLISILKDRNLYIGSDSHIYLDVYLEYIEKYHNSNRVIYEITNKISDDYKTITFTIITRKNSDNYIPTHIKNKLNSKLPNSNILDKLKNKLKLNSNDELVPKIEELLSGKKVQTQVQQPVVNENRKRLIEELKEVLQSIQVPKTGSGN